MPNPAASATLASNALIGAGVVAAIGAGAYVILQGRGLFTGAADLLNTTGDTARTVGEDASRIIEDTTGLGRDLVGGADRYLRIGGDLIGGASSGGLSQERKDAALGELKVLVLGKKDENKWGKKYTAATFQVIDAKTGRAVPYATVHVHFQFNATRRALGNQTLQTDSQGLYRGFSWTVADVPGTAKEDDAIITASAPGYNTSQPVEVR